MFKRILVPLDGSQLSEQALPLALTLAEAVGGEIILLRSLVLVHMMLPEMAMEYDWVWPADSEDSSRHEVTGYLTNLQNNLQRPDLAVRFLAVQGDEAGAIVDAAQTENVDLIVMSSHGYSGFTRWMLGSVTEKVLHSAPCPVFVVQSPQPVSHVLITLDGSPLAEKALAPGIELAQRFGAKVTLLQVNALLPFGYGEPLASEWAELDTTQGLFDQMHKSSETYLVEIAGRHHSQNLPIEIKVIDGLTVTSILDFVESANVDLVVMSTHGRSGLRRWLYGSVTAKVLRSAPCSMLIVRPPVAELS